MSNSWVQIPVDDVGKCIRTWQTSVSGTDVHQHYMVIADESGNVASLTASGMVQVSGAFSATIGGAISGVVSVSGPVSGQVGVSGAVSGVMSVSGTVTATGCVSAAQGTSPWVVSFSTMPVNTQNAVSGVVSVSGTVNATGAVSAVQGGNWTVSVSSPVATITTVQSATVYQGTSPWVDRPQNVATANSAVPLFAGLIGGTDGTNILGLRANASGVIDVQGVATLTSATPLRGMLVGGTDGTNIRGLAVRTTGDLRHIATANSAVPGFVAVVGGSDGTNAPPLALRAGGDFRFVATTASAIPGFVANVGGTDGTNLNPIGVNSSGSVQIAGNVAHDGADSGNPIKIGGVCMISTFPASVSTSDRANFITDKYGAQITRLEGTRDQIVANHAGAVTTSETTILSAVASCYVDLYAITFSNLTTSEHTVTIKDGTAGTTKFIIPLRSMSVDGIAFTRPWPQSAISCHWTAQLAATGTVAVSAYGVKYV